MNRRLALVAELWKLKSELGLETVDPDRERELRETLAAANDGLLSPAGLDRLVTDLLDLTKKELGRLSGDSASPLRLLVRLLVRLGGELLGETVSRKRRNSSGRDRRASRGRIRRRELRLVALEHDARLLDHLVGSEDLCVGAQRQRDRVGRAGVDVDLVAVPASVIEAWKVFSRSSVTVTCTISASRRDDRGGKIVGHRPRRLGALEVHQDRRCLGMADPDRQKHVVAVAVFRSTIGCLPTRSKLTP